MTHLIDQIDDLLPQTQCGQCGYPACRPYAEAVATGAPHTLCPPGGDALQASLARLLGRPSLPLTVPESHHVGVRLKAVIREDECIGCTKCIQACPVDAIMGASQFMHTVISHECTGCELCVAPCPVDCIDMVLRPASEQHLSRETAFHARERYHARQQRQQRLMHEKQEEHARRRATRKQVAKSLAIQTMPETTFNQIKADYQKTRMQLKQLQAAINHLQRQGQTPCATHLAQLEQLTQKVALLKEQVRAGMEAAKESMAAHGLDLSKLKLDATRSELALRRAQAQRADAATLQQLQQQRDEDQEKLYDAMRSAGMTEPD